MHGEQIQNVKFETENAPFTILPLSKRNDNKMHDDDRAKPSLFHIV